MAYLTAATHGFEEDAHKLKAELEARGQPIPIVDANALILAPPQPVHQIEENWPQLAMSTGPFDASILAAGSKGVASTATAKAAR